MGSGQASQYDSHESRQSWRKKNLAKKIKLLSSTGKLVKTGFHCFRLEWFFPKNFWFHSIYSEAPSQSLKRDFNLALRAC